MTELVGRTKSGDGLKYYLPSSDGITWASIADPFLTAKCAIVAMIAHMVVSSFSSLS